MNPNEFAECVRDVNMLPLPFSVSLRRCGLFFVELQHNGTRDANYEHEGTKHGDWMDGK
jgi:hypothetical protein